MKCFLFECVLILSYLVSLFLQAAEEAFSPMRPPIDMDWAKISDQVGCFDCEFL